MTTTEAAKYLEVTKRQVVHLINIGKLSAFKFGLVWVIDPASVERYKLAPKDKGGRPRKRQA